MPTITRTKTGTSLLHSWANFRLIPPVVDSSVRTSLLRAVDQPTTMSLGCEQIPKRFPEPTMFCTLSSSGTAFDKFFKIPATGYPSRHERLLTETLRIRCSYHAVTVVAINDAIGSSTFVRCIDEHIDGKSPSDASSMKQLRIDRFSNSQPDKSGQGVFTLLPLFSDWIFEQSGGAHSVLDHPDFDIHHFIVSDNGTLRAIIDWDGACSEPRIIAPEGHPD